MSKLSERVKTLETALRQCEMSYRRVIRAQRVNADRDAEWLAALWTWKRYRPECLSNFGDIQRASNNPAPCPGCVPLRALVAGTGPAPRPPRES